MSWSTTEKPGPVVATAVHNGHDMRPDLLGQSSLSGDQRLREEDPYTGTIAQALGTSIVLDSSRFELDINRARDEAVYLQPEQAWGLPLWVEPLSDKQIYDSLAIYDEFYRHLGAVLDAKVAEYGFFILLDIHSYNHRRSSSESSGDNPETEPVINVGSSNMAEHGKTWFASMFTELLGRNGPPALSDVRMDIRFRGGHLVRWAHIHYPTGYAVALELKKVFMDEWSGELDREVLDRVIEVVSNSAQEMMDIPQFREFSGR